MYDRSGSSHGHSLPAFDSNNSTETVIPASNPLVPPGRTINAFASASEEIALDLSKPTGIACNVPSTISTFSLTNRVNGFAFGKSFVILPLHDICADLSYASMFQ